MNFFKSITFLGLVATLSGCATSSSVQEMIDAANMDYRTQLRSHEESLDVLRQSAKAGLEKSSQNAVSLKEVEEQMAQINRQMVIVQDLANASKVMSAANTVKVSELGEQLRTYKEENDEIIERMTEIDKLYEEILLRQFQEIADSANAAIASLQENGFSASTNAPVLLDELFEIDPPDTTVPTNIAEPME